MIVLVVVIALISQGFAQSDDPCSIVQYEDLCNYTFGCIWAESGSVGCNTQSGYDEGTLVTEPYDCSNADLNIPFGYDCWVDKNDDYHYYVYINTSFDACSFQDYAYGGCPEVLDDGVKCDFFFVNESDTSGSCYTKPDDSNWDYPEAGLCYNRTIAGCAAFPNCDYYNGSCNPDVQCYYEFVNSDTCRSGSEGPCRRKQIPAVIGDDYCSTDTIISENEACIGSIFGIHDVDAAKSACEAAKCEFVKPGTAPGWGSFSWWCAPVGSDASVVKVSAFVITILLTSILAVL